LKKMGSSALPIGDAAVEIAWGFGHEGATRQILNAYFRAIERLMEQGYPRNAEAATRRE